MTAFSAEANLRDLTRRLRIIALLDAAERLGMVPLPAAALHSIAYFTDVLAPVWHLPTVDAQMLKQPRPYYPALQDDLDRLVGQGVVVVTNVTYHEEGSAGWRLDGRYSLHRPFADRILDALREFPQQIDLLDFVEEVVAAVSGLDPDAISSAGQADATFSDPLVDVGGMINVDPEEGLSRTAEVASRFGRLLGREPDDLSPAELTHLYVRRLYSRIRDV